MSKNKKKQEYQTDTKYARRICGKFNGNDNSMAIFQERLGTFGWL